MTKRLTRQLPTWTDKSTGEQVQALKIGRLIPSPRGVSIYPVDDRYAAFDQNLWWVREGKVEPGDFIVWETGKPAYSCRPDAFEARFRPAAIETDS